MEKVKSEKVEMNISRWGSLGEPAPTKTPWLRTPQKKFGCFKTLLLLSHPKTKSGCPNLTYPDLNIVTRGFTQRPGEPEPKLLPSPSSWKRLNGSI
jgi:hypothetical protein